VEVLVDPSRPDTSRLDAFLAETVLKNERERNERD